MEFKRVLQKVFLWGQPNNNFTVDSRLFFFLRVDMCTEMTSKDVYMHCHKDLKLLKLFSLSYQQSHFNDIRDVHGTRPVFINTECSSQINTLFPSALNF